mmetsp:Transcript_10583/g.39424  ORF Transcript_10583/g.39424 Transcript_10583/m.39424 type:complete len:212 (+) Transcript_10583:505-1140(+)
MINEPVGKHDAIQFQHRYRILAEDKIWWAFGEELNLFCFGHTTHLHIESGIRFAHIEHISQNSGKIFATISNIGLIDGGWFLESASFHLEWDRCKSLSLHIAIQILCNWQGAPTNTLLGNGETIVLFRGDFQHHFNVQCQIGDIMEGAHIHVVDGILLRKFPSILATLVSLCFYSIYIGEELIAGEIHEAHESLVLYNVFVGLKLFRVDIG